MLVSYSTTWTKWKKWQLRKNEQDIYENTVELILDPHDPEVIKAAREEGISEAWIKAAQNLLCTNL